MKGSSRPDRRKKDLLELHIQNSPLAVVEWDRDFRVIRWSGQAEALFGWSEAEVLGKHPAEWRFVHADDVGSVDTIMSELLGGGSRNLSVNRNYNRDGNVVHCEWHNSTLLVS